MLHDIIDKFVKLNDHIEIHKFPTGAFILRNKSKSSGITHLSKQELEYVNGPAKTFFVLANGENTLLDIFRKMYGDKWVNYKQHLFNFVEISLLKNDIILTPHKSHWEGKITGSDKQFYPLHISIELTYLCQLKCLHCYANSGNFRENVFIEFKTLKRALSILAQKGLRIVELTGGEPLLYPNFDQLLKFLYSNFDIIALLTNGYSIDKEMVGFLKNYKDKLIINISLDASNSKLHDHLRGMKGAFEKAINAIKDLSDNNLFVRVTMSVYPHTIEEIEPTLLLAKKLGARSFVWNPVLPFGRADKFLKNNHNLDYCHFNEISRNVFEKHKDFILWIPSDEVDKMMLPYNCGAGWRSVVLDPYGNFRPCLYMEVNQINLGNIYQSPIEEIFSKKIFHKLFNLIPPKREICKDCEYFSFCKNCIARGVKKSSELGGCSWTRNQRVFNTFTLTYGDKNLVNL